MKYRPGETMSNAPPEQANQQVNIEIGEKEAEGTYSNLAIITHSNAEFVIDFTRILPGVPKAKVQSRIIMTPVHTKLLMNALRDNIDKYEQKFGEIKISGDPQQMFTNTPPGSAVH
jgi:Protein of unknown function (DUF3467)